MHPHDDDALSALGEEQARRVAEYLTLDPPYDLLVCSPLLRARQTAQIISKRLRLEPVVIEALFEMTDRELGRLMLAALTERLPFVRHPTKIRASQGLRSSLLDRVSGVIQELIAEHANGRAVLVAHGGVIWGTLAHYFPDQRSRLTKERQVANCSVTRIALHPHGAELIALNEIAHLGDAVTF
jgi:uncharacterized phosphatase